MPYLKFSLQTPLSIEEAAARITVITRASDGFWDTLRYRFGRSTNPNIKFIGEASSTYFKIRRDITYRNSFLPIIHGEFHKTIRGSEISILMFLHPFVLVFMLIWLTCIGFGVWAAISHSKGAVVLFPIGMILFGLGLTAGGFFPEAFKAKRILIDTFEANENGA
jgi:hypothetical protein